MRLSIPQLAIAVISLALFTALLFIMVVRKLRAKFPLFFAFIALFAIATILVNVAYEFRIHNYFYLYWTLSTLLMLLGFGVMYEVFVTMLKPFSAVIDLAKTLFIWATIFLLAAGFLTAMVTSGPGSNKLAVAIDLCDRCVHMMQCGLLLLIVLWKSA